MDTKVLPTFGLILFASAVGSASVETADTRTPPPAVSVATVDAADASPKAVKLPGEVPVQRHYYDVPSGQVVSTPPGARSGTPGELAYSCTPPPSVYLPPGPRLIADDVTTVAAGACGDGGCDVTAYEIAVRRSVGECKGVGTIYCDSDADCPTEQSCTPWDDPDFGVEFAIWDDCPGNVGAEIIPGTQGAIQLPASGFHIITVALDPAMRIRQSFWVSTVFDAPGAGWVMGTPAEVGFTEDLFHFALPGFSCSATTGLGLYAGFYVRVFCEAPLDREFPAYLNQELDGRTLVGPGIGEWRVDDVELIVDNCILTSLKIGVVGTPGAPFNVDAEIWRFCNGNTVVEGTQQSQEVVSDGTPQWVCFDYPGGIPLPAGNSFWVAWKFNNTSLSIIAGQAAIGFTDDLFGLSEGGQCNFHWFGGDPYAGFAISLRCAGDPPLGACCDLAASEGAYCRETTEFNCQGSLTRWRAGVTCDDPEVFDPPCGYSACCEPADLCNNRPFIDDGIVGGCSEIFDDSPTICRLDIEDPESGSGAACTYDADCPPDQVCTSNRAVWQRGLFCDDPSRHCDRWLCRFADGACDVAHGTTGCNNRACCDRICDQDAWCCLVDWDDLCVAKAVARVTGCDLSPSNDECWVGRRCSISRDRCNASSECPPGEVCEPDADFGARPLNKCSDHTAPGDPSCTSDADCNVAQQEACVANGITRMSNVRGSANYDGLYSASEELCCHPSGAGIPGTSGVWAKFVAGSGTAMLDTCFSDVSGTDSILQVFRVGDPSSLESACNSLSAIACSDDAAGCIGQGNSRVCLSDLTIGATYYVLLATSPSGVTGDYKIRLTSPASMSICGDPDECDGGCPDIQIVGSTPASGSIDAGQPSDPDGQNPTGWSSVTIDFDGATETLAVTDFIISVTGGAAPSVIHVAPEGNSATLTLDAPIPVGQWTRITHCGSGASVCLGYLPADVNGDGTTAPSDILGLLDSLNGVAPLPDYSVDVDRSGDPGPPDVLRVIDLLNGAAAYDPWIHVSLPASPCAP